MTRTPLPVTVLTPAGVRRPPTIRPVDWDHMSWPARKAAAERHARDLVDNPDRARRSEAALNETRTAKPRKAPRQLVPCGTVSAAKRHYRRHEPLDDACRAAHNAWVREGERRRQAKTDEQLLDALAVVVERLTAEAALLAACPPPEPVRDKGLDALDRLISRCDCGAWRIAPHPCTTCEHLIEWEVAS